jgi:uncharacterized protein HemX
MSQDKTPTKTQPTNRLGVAGVIVGCLAFIVALGTLFLTIENRLEQNKLQLLPATIPQLIKNTTSESIRSALEGVDKHLANQRQSIQAVQQALAKSHGPIQRAQAKVLINLAQLSQQTSSQLSVTIALLQQARQKLSSPQDDALIHDINQDLKYLQADKGATTGKLLASLEQSNQLTSQLEAQSPRSAALQVKTPAKHWYQRWWRNFQTLFVVQRINNDNKRLLSPDQAALIKAALALQLDTARWALLQSNTALFQQSIHRAKQLASEGFKNTSHLTTLRAVLTTLASAKASPAYSLLSYQLVNH